MAPGCAKRQRGEGNSRDDAESKKAKLDGHVQRQIQVVCDAVGTARDRSEDCQAMLEAMVQGSLAKGRDERDEIQEDAVRLIGDMISKLENDAIAKLNHTEAIVRDPEGTKATVQRELGEAMDAADEADKEVGEKRKRLRDARNGVADAQKRLAASEKALASHIQEQEILMKEKTDFEKAYSTHFTALRDGDWNAAAEAKEHVQALIPLFDRFDYEESLINAFTPAAGRKPCDRRHFDKIVVDQAEKSFLQHVDNLQGKIQAAEPAVDRARAAMDSCEVHLGDCWESDRAAALLLGKALTSQRRAQRLLQDARQVNIEFPEGAEKATSGRDAAHQALLDFRRGPLDAYTFLCNRVAALELVTQSADDLRHHALAGA